MKTFISRSKCALLLCLSWCLAGAAHAEYPDKPIRIVAPFAAGGPADVLARLVGKGLSSRLGTTVLVENRAGAGGNIGTDAVAKAPADGYTLLLGYIGPLAVNPHLFSTLPFNPETDFAPIGLIADNPLVLVVHPSLPARSVKELVAQLRASKSPLAYASGGSGSANHLAAELFKAAEQVEMTHVAYKGIAPATSDLLGGQVPIMFNGVSVALPHIKAEKLRALAVTTKNRIPALPDVPTMQEAGLPGYEMSAWFALLAPAGTPPAIVQRLEAALMDTVRSPEAEATLSSLGMVPRPAGSQALRSLVKSELQVWGKVVRQAGIKAE
ncbi:Bug family tripartite tricarboxylate transporter substrate binding protein [Hydrogenophaga sp.]|jgi:tripartite-type tricarboxylate transporter receptor subunit TctC|uniref:Bug family tripartite tricarboxylate transporter substrate binding protein n=1 Tax=Hydrogenophaga sp. TaxID=1904254 RepID=UPI003F71D955